MLVPKNSIRWLGLHANELPDATWQCKSTGQKLISIKIKQTVIGHNGSAKILPVEYPRCPFCNNGHGLPQEMSRILIEDLEDWEDVND